MSPVELRKHIVESPGSIFTREDVLQLLDLTVFGPEPGGAITLSRDQAYQIAAQIIDEVEFNDAVEVIKDSAEFGIDSGNHIYLSSVETNIVEVGLRDILVAAIVDFEITAE